MLDKGKPIAILRAVVAGVITELITVACMVLVFFIQSQFKPEWPWPVDSCDLLGIIGWLLIIVIAPLFVTDIVYGKYVTH